MRYKKLTPKAAKDIQWWLSHCSIKDKEYIDAVIKTLKDLEDEVDTDSDNNK